MPRPLCMRLGPGNRTTNAHPGRPLEGVLGLVNAYRMPRGSFMSRRVSPTREAWGFFYPSRDNRIGAAPGGTTPDGRVYEIIGPGLR